MKTLAALLTATFGLLAAPLSAQATQFDLICDYGASERSRYGELSSSYSQPRHIQIDLDAGRWCDGNCGTSSIFDIHEAAEGNLVLKLEKDVVMEGTANEFTVYEHITYDRATGVFSKVYESNSEARGVLRTTETNPCEEQTFSGLSWSEFKPPQIRNQTRFIRDLNESRTGKAMSALSPEGTTPVLVRVQVDEDGRPEQCKASAPTPLPELEAAVCDFVTRQSVSFNPALNPAGEPVSGEYRQTMTFAN